MGAEITLLIRRIAAGDSQAKQSLFDQFGGRLFRRLGFRYTPMQLDAEDLLHDVFVLFFSHDARTLKRFLERTAESERSTERFEQYLWDQACGVASNQLRARRTMRRYVSDEQAEDTVDPLELARQIVDQQMMKLFEDCIGGHGERFKLYFALRFVDGLTPDEIVRATGWTSEETYRLRERLNRVAAECAEKLGIAP